MEKMKDSLTILDDEWIKSNRGMFKITAILFNALSLIAVLIQLISYFNTRAMYKTPPLFEVATGALIQPYPIAYILCGIITLVSIFLFYPTRKGWSIFFSSLATLTPWEVHRYYFHFIFKF